MNEELVEKFKKVKIIFMDIDGVLTDGSVIFIGTESPRKWYVRDRAAIKILKSLAEGPLPKVDIKIIWITARPSEELTQRADELGVDEVHSDIRDKLKIMEEVLTRYNIAFSDAMYIGDDLIDIASMERAGVSCCPQDAVDEIKEQADFVSSYPGGRGAVREIIEKVLKSRGIWKNVVDRFRKDGRIF